MAAALAACSHEPLHPPELPNATQYTPGPPVEQTVSAAGVHGGEAQRFVTGQDIPAQWWSLFKSPQLDALVRQALQNSPTLAQASAKLRRPLHRGSSARW